MESTRRVWAAGPRIGVIRPGELDVVDRGNHAPYVHERFARRLIGCRVDQPDIGRQRKGDPNQAVLPQVAEINGRVSIGAEIIGIDGPEEWIVGLRIELAAPLEQLKSRLRARGRELETVARHVAVGARPSVAAQAMEAPVHERAEPARDRIARLGTAIEWASWLDANLLLLRRCRGAADAHRHRGGEYKAACGELMPRSHRIFSSLRRRLSVSVVMGAPASRVTATPAA